jgi:hypothetical protein
VSSYQLSTGLQIKIGVIDQNRTKFNVGDGLGLNRSYNHIRIKDTAGTNQGIVDDPWSVPVPGLTYYDFVILAPGCSRTNDTNVAIDHSYDSDGHHTGSTTVDLKLIVGEWKSTVFDMYGNQSDFGFCLEVSINIITDDVEALLIKKKDFDFQVAILKPYFGFGSSDHNPSTARTDIASRGLIIGITFFAMLL